MRRMTGGLMAWLMGLLMACTSRPADERIVSVTIEPQRYFAERIAGDHYTIHCVVPEGQSPETYDPTPQQMVRVGKSVAYLRIGAIGFEQAWMAKLQENHPALRVFDLSSGIRLAEVPEEEGAHAHHPHHSHHHHPGGVDPHIWSSIGGAKVIARNTLEAFVALNPAHRTDYEANYNQLLNEIEQTEQVVSELLRPLKHKAFIIYHPALSYLAAEYGLTQLCIEMDGKEPTPAQLRELVEVARTHGAKVVFIQQEFDQKNAELIARETGCRLVTIHPLAADWSREMIHIAKSLADGEAD